MIQDPRLALDTVKRQHHEHLAVAAEERQARLARADHPSVRRSRRPQLPRWRVRISQPRPTTPSIDPRGLQTS